MDTSPYIKEKWVQFPFDAYFGSGRDGTFIQKGEWFKMFDRYQEDGVAYPAPYNESTSIDETFEFYLPSWLMKVFIKMLMP